MIQLTPIFAFGVVSLPILGWLAAAAAPILIHLWSRRKHREMSWAAMEYLLAAMRRKTRRLHFEQWLLLALRTLIVVLLVMAVAEPFLQPSRLIHGSAARTHRVIVIDERGEIFDGDMLMWLCAKDMKARKALKKSPHR